MSSSQSETTDAREVVAAAARIRELEARLAELEADNRRLVAQPVLGCLAGCGAVEPISPDQRRILIIEDNQDAADSLREALRLYGHEVEIAYDGPAGIERARRFQPHIVFCDIGLPRMDGYAVARAFRTDGQLRNIRLVALSGYALPDDVKRATEAGFERHVAKPPCLDNLAAIL